MARSSERAQLPGEIRDQTGRRLAHLPAAVIGNGSLLATLSGRGEFERLFWPRIDWGQHLGELRVGVAIEGETRWLDEEPFQHRQAYVQDANALRTEVIAGDLRLELLDFVLPDRPVVVRSIRASRPGLRLVVYCRPALEESERYGGAYVDPRSGALAFYRRGTALAVALAPNGAGSCGPTRPGAASSVRADAVAGELNQSPIGYGRVDGALMGALLGESLLLMAFGRTPDEALRELERPLTLGAEALLAERLEHDGSRLGTAAPPQRGSSESAKVYRRSLLVFDLLTDRESGAVIAAPESDADFLHSGGYGFVWGRDLAFVVLAFLATGRTDLVRPALRWLTRTQSPEGLWLHRHWTDGSLAPSWGLHQLDETGAILFAFHAATAALRDWELGRELWPSARRAADFLLEFRDPETCLLRPSVDLWEEREGEHAYTAAAAVGGLRAAAAMAERYEPARAGSYRHAAEQIRQAIERELWDETRGRYLRARLVGRGESNGRTPPSAFEPTLPYPTPPINGVDDLDATLDASLLGLAWPFRAVEPNSPRMVATAAAIEQRLSLRDGGLLRYEGDTYAGGNAWIVTTLWLGLWYRQIGDSKGFQRCLGYAIERQNHVGLLPEQVARDGKPAWVVPLTWSHAMFALMLRPELRIIAS
jgi:oligosaccharide amylase